MQIFDEFRQTIAHLRSEKGCPWDREQTHESLKLACIEEAVEVIAGVDILSAGNKADNLKEELGDLLLQVMMQSQIAEEEGLFSIEDVIKTVNDKMIRRHPHVFGELKLEASDEVLKNWQEIKSVEKEGRAWEKDYVKAAFNEALELLEKARIRAEK